MDPWTKHDRVPPNVNDAHNQDCWKIFIIIGPAGHRTVNIYLGFLHSNVRLLEGFHSVKTKSQPT